MKVAVVIPTRNEAQTIAAVVAAADAGLEAQGGGGLIVNADSDSDDGTGQAFLATPTRTPKRLLAIDGTPGKGRNLLAAWRLCLDEGVDAVVMLDGDMRTVQPWWIPAFLRPIAARGADFVSPLYRRSPYRGVSARSVSRAFHYAWFGVDVQHPLSGNASVATILGESRPWATAQLDICADAERFGYRQRIAHDVLTATVQVARRTPPRLGAAGPVETAPMTFVERTAPEIAWLESRIADACGESAACRQDYARWAGDRFAEIEAAIEARRLDASAWFHVFAHALLEARERDTRRAAADYATALGPLFSLRVLSVWRESERLPAEAIDAAAAAEVGVMRAALAAAAA